MTNGKITIPAIGYDQVIKLIVLIVAGTMAYMEIETKLTDLERRQDEASSKIEELLDKHIEEETQIREELIEELSWYQKELNINPLNWGKKRKKRK